MKDDQILGFCNRERIRLPVSWRHSLNAVRYHDKRETWNHFLFKASVAYELMNRGQTIFTELKLANRHEQPVTDLLWLDEKIGVEFESEWSHKKAQLKMQQYCDFNVFVFDIKRESMDFVKQKLGLL